MAWLGSQRGQLSLLLVLALLPRLAFIFSHRPTDFLIGGDGPWYIQQGWFIAHQSLPGPLATVGPLYPIVLAAVWLLFPMAPQPVDISVVPPAYLALVRLIQIALSLLVVWLGYQLARRMSGKHSAGMIAAIGLGLGPAFVIEPIYILTEPIFMALLAVWAWLYIRAQAAPSIARFAAAGFTLALAALARPVALLLPVVLLPHPFLVFRPREARKWAASLLGVFVLAVLPWSLYLYKTTGSIAPEGFLSNLWMGAVGSGQWEGTLTMYQKSQMFGGDNAGYAREALSAILSDPLHWLGLRAGNLAAAVLTPHGTSDLGGPSIKQLFGTWLSHDRSGEGLWAITRTASFYPKLAIYGFHFFALGMGTLGGWVSIRRWRDLYPLYAAIGYLVGVYAVLTVLPRYLFPAEVFMWVLAGIGLVWLWDRHQRHRVSATDDLKRHGPAT